MITHFEKQKEKRNVLFEMFIEIGKDCFGAVGQSL